MKWTPFLSAVFLGAAVTTAMENARSGGGGGGADGPKPTASMHGSVGGGVVGHHSHHGHGHHSYTGAGHEHMSGTFTMEGPQPTGGVEGGAMQKRGAARGGNHQSGSGGGEHTMPGGPPAGSHFPSGPRPSGKGHHTGAGGDGEMPSFTLSEGAQQTGGAAGGMVKRGLHGGHHSHGGGHQSMTGGQQTITSITHVHVPTTLTTMITANGH